MSTVVQFRRPVIAEQPAFEFPPPTPPVPTIEVITRAELFRRQWLTFVDERPDVVAWMVAEVRRLVAGGASQVSAKTLLGVARSRFLVGIDNNWPSSAADWLEDSYPEFAGLFIRRGRPSEQRAVRVTGGDGCAP